MTTNQHYQIKKISVRGFRNFANVDNLELPQLAVLVGANGTGKSNLLQFLKMLSGSLRPYGLQAFVMEYGGGNNQLFGGSKTTQHIEAQITLETNNETNEYCVKFVYNSKEDTLYFGEEVLNINNKQLRFSAVGKNSILPQLVVDKSHPARSVAQSIIDTLKNYIVYQFHDTSAKSNLNIMWDETDNAYLLTDGSNLAPVLLRLMQDYPQRYQFIVRQIQQVIPTFDDFVLEPINGKVILKWKAKNSNIALGPHLTSDGTLRIFCLFTLLNLPDDMLPNVVMLDELELGLHPHVIALVTDMVKSLAERRQVLIATQSPLIVDAFEAENIIMVSSQNDGATKMTPMIQTDYQFWLEEGYTLSDVWLKELM